MCLGHRYDVDIVDRIDVTLPHGTTAVVTGLMGPGGVNCSHTTHLGTDNRTVTIQVPVPTRNALLYISCD